MVGSHRTKDDGGVTRSWAQVGDGEGERQELEIDDQEALIKARVGFN